MYSTTSDSVLLVGGTGTIGTHLSTHFLASKSFAKVHILSRSAASNANRQVEGATYVTGDVTSEEELRRAIEETKPSVVIHCASPSPASPDYRNVLIRGTGNLLRAAKESEHVRAAIYTSSSTIAAGKEHIDITEDTPLANEDSDASAYARAKATADLRVLGFNTPKPDHAETWRGSLLTACLRLPLVYSTSDAHAPKMSPMLGDGANMWSFCSTSNMANAHLLLASALLDQSSKPEHMEVHGEAFHINDGTPLPYHSLFPGAPFSSSPLPADVAIMLAMVLEWAFFFFTLGLQHPAMFTKEAVSHAYFTHTYSIEKARMRLGYKPRVELERGTLQSGWREKMGGNL